MTVNLSRRGFIFGAGATAFAIVRPEILMPIKQLWTPYTFNPCAEIPLPPGQYNVVIDSLTQLGNQILMTLVTRDGRKVRHTYKL